MNNFHEHEFIEPCGCAVVLSKRTIPNRLLLNRITGCVESIELHLQQMKKFSSCSLPLEDASDSTYVHKVGTIFCFDDKEAAEAQLENSSYGKYDFEKVIENETQLRIVKVYPTGTGKAPYPKVKQPILEYGTKEVFDIALDVIGKAWEVEILPGFRLKLLKRK